MKDRAMYGVAHAFHLPLPKGKVHMAAMSPPYFMQRDYGTAVWEGGDPACTHEMVVDDGPKQRSNKGAAGHTHRDCRCGARRIDQQLGLETLHDCLAWARGEPPCGRCYVCDTRAWAAEIWRVLRDDGVFWLNLGDSYAAGGGYSPDSPTSRSGSSRQGEINKDRRVHTGKKTPPPGLKPKDLVGIPARVVLALQTDGWHWRSKVTWCKKSPMPESVDDRPTSATEDIFLLTKRPDYFYDAEAVKVDSSPETLPRLGRAVGNDHKNVDGAPGQTPHSINQPRKNSSERRRDEQPSLRRNLWNYWIVSTAGYPGAHYATWPEELVETMIKAGTSERGVCPECGAQWERVVRKGPPENRGDNPNDVLLYDGGSGHNNGAGATTLHKARSSATVGWRPGCSCYGVTVIANPPRPPARMRGESDAAFLFRFEGWQEHDAAWSKLWSELSPIYGALPSVPATVLDAFAGSGTTLAVARRLGRLGLGFDLSEAYLYNDCRVRLGHDKLQAWEMGKKGGHEDEAGLPLFSTPPGDAS